MKVFLYTFNLHTSIGNINPKFQTLRQAQGPVMHYCNFIPFDRLSEHYSEFNVLSFDDHNFLNLVSLTDGINHFNTLINFSETGMVTVEVGSVSSAVADEEL